MALQWADVPFEKPAFLDKTFYLRETKPAWFQNRGAFNVTAKYTAMPGGNIKVTNTEQFFIGRELQTHVVHGEAQKVGQGHLKVSFLPINHHLLFAGDYCVVQFVENEYMIVASPDIKYLWLLTCTRDSDITKIVKDMLALGVNLEELQPIAHHPSI